MTRDPKLAPPSAEAGAGGAEGSGGPGDAAGPAREARPVARLRPMLATDVGAVHAVEVAAYPFPWTRGNFVDSLAAGYPAQVLEEADGALVAYFVAMPGVDEMHLLNITVAPRFQGRGHARTLIEALLVLCREHAAAQLWLEVRAGNERARAIYAGLGFVATGRRKGYYPASFGRREDAIVMSLALGASPGAMSIPARGGSDALG